MPYYHIETVEIGRYLMPVMAIFTGLAGWDQQTPWFPIIFCIGFAIEMWNVYTYGSILASMLTTGFAKKVWKEVKMSIFILAAAGIFYIYPMVSYYDIFSISDNNSD